ncbi:MAG: 3'-5' exonuclease, partial [Thermomicrobiales bacterium]
TLFKGMVYGDLIRLQLDIETTGLDSSAPDARVLMVALTTSTGFAEALINDGNEADLIMRLNARISELDPDVIEGHNIFNFDLPWLAARAVRHGIDLAWGRDRSPLRVEDYQSRFKAGQHSLPFRMATVHGRHIIDTYQQIQRFDTAGRLSSYGLKNAIRELGLERPDRTHVEGAKIQHLWLTDRERLARYALDDVRDVEVLAQLTTQTEFYQTQLLPRSFQATASGGPGEKINDLLVRAYLDARHSLPVSQPARDYPGGHAELLQTGVFQPVVKCDVESLYPSIMLHEHITSASDTLGAYLPMLGDLTRRRLDAKTRSKREGQLGNIAAQTMWNGIQSSFKVLINSFYGYLGYRAGLFNDFDAAARVTIEGQRLVKQVVMDLLTRQ